MPSVTLVRPFSAFFSTSQLAATSSGVSAVTSPKTWGWRAHQLVVHAPGHVGQGEPALLGGQGGVEVHLEEQVAELLLEVGHGPLLGDVRRPGHVRGAASTAATASMASSTS